MHIAVLIQKMRSASKADKIKNSFDKNASMIDLLLNGKYTERRREGDQRAEKKHSRKTQDDYPNGTVSKYSQILRIVQQSKAKQNQQNGRNERRKTRSKYQINKLKHQSILIGTCMRSCTKQYFRFGVAFFSFGVCVCEWVCVFSVLCMCAMLFVYKKQYKFIAIVY